MLDKKESIMPQQNAQADQVKEKLGEFFLKVREFRNSFRKEAPFLDTYTSNEAYDLMDKFMSELIDLKDEIDEYGELEELFEIPPKSYPEATETLAEMRQLKLLWDFHSYCDSKYEEWGSQHFPNSHAEGGTRSFFGTLLKSTEPLAPSSIISLLMSSLQSQLSNK